MTKREEFIRRIECPDIKITNITTDVPKHFHQNQSPNVFYAYITYKNEYPFITQCGCPDGELRHDICSIDIFTQKGGRVGFCYSHDRIADRISEYINKRERLKNRKENPDTLEVIRQFLKEDIKN
jgi:hypothetical protein